MLFLLFTVEDSPEPDMASLGKRSIEEAGADEQEDSTQSGADSQEDEASRRASHLHTFKGMVVDKRSNFPVDDFLIGLYRRSSSKKPWLAQGDRERFSDVSGLFSLEREVENRMQYQLQVTAKGFHRGASRVFFGFSTEVTTQIEILLQPFPRIEGEVIDDATGIPLDNAIIASATDLGPELGYDDDFTAVHHARSNVSGRFILDVEDPGTHTLLTRHPDFRENVTAGVDPSEGRVKIHMRRGFVLSGTAHAPDGVPVEGALVRIMGERGANLPLKHDVRTGPGGVFISNYLHPGFYRISLEEVPGFPTLSTFFGAEAVLLHDWDVEDTRVGGRRDRAVLLGTVLANRRPVPNAKVHVRYASSLEYGLLDPGYLKSYQTLAETDEEGNFYLNGLRGGEYLVRFTMPGMDNPSPMDFPVYLKPGLPSREAFDTGGGTLMGRLFAEEGGKRLEYIAGQALLYHFKQSDTEVIGKAAIEKDGYFSIPWVAPGEYTLIIMAKGYETERVDFSFRGGRTGEVKAWLKPSVPAKVGVEMYGMIERETPSFSLFLEGAWFDLPKDIVVRTGDGHFLFDCPDGGSLSIKCSLLGIIQEEKIYPQNFEKPFIFEIGPVARVQGHVETRPSRRPVGRCRVCLVERDWRSKRSRRRNLRDGRFPYGLVFQPRTDLYSGVADSNGFYEILLPEEGEYYIGIFGDTGFQIPLAANRRDSIRVDENRGRPELENFYVGDTAIAGRIVETGTGTPIQQADLYVHYRREYPVMTRPDENGIFCFRNLPHSRYDLWIEAPGYPVEPVRKILSSPMNKREDHDIALGEGGASLWLFVDGRFNRQNAHPSEFEVSIGEGKEKKEFTLSQLIRDQEEWIFLAHGLPIGKHKIEVSMRRPDYKASIDVELFEDRIAEARFFLE
jgi:hypothetical protein